MLADDLLHISPEKTASADNAPLSATVTATRGAEEFLRPKMSVIIPVFNGRLQLPRCLQALCASEFSDFEVIVVDDCSTDNTRQIVERYAARYVRMPRTAGPAAARNLGVRHAEGDVVVFVDADVVVPPEALGLVASDFDGDPELAAVFGSYDEAPAWPDFLSQYKNLMHHYVHQVSSARAVTFWAGCGAMRKSVFEEFGGFDAGRYPHPSIEDIELGFRLSRAGRKILLEKRLQAKHLKRWTLRSLLRADIALRAVPWTRLILETRNLPHDLNLTHAAKASAALVGLLLLALLLLPLAAGGLPWLTLPVLVLAILAAILLLLVLNWKVYVWFSRQRGVWFAIRAALAHWAYYFYSGVTFVFSWLRHHLRASARPAPREAVPQRE